jgi:chemotaxis protein CheY-P-specific phosphatase CheC
MKKGKGSSGRAIIAAARKIAVIIWNMMTGGDEFDQAKMADEKLAKKSERMSKSAGMAKEARAEG